METDLTASLPSFAEPIWSDVLGAALLGCASLIAADCVQLGKGMVRKTRLPKDSKGTMWAD